MKKLIVIMVALVIAVAAAAQNPAPKPPSNQPSKTKMDNDVLSVMMKDGKVWQKAEGKTTVILTDVTIGGTVVSPDGTVMMADGYKTVLKEGESIGMDGKIRANDVMPQKYPPEKMDNK